MREREREERGNRFYIFTTRILQHRSMDMGPLQTHTQTGQSTMRRRQRKRVMVQLYANSSVHRSIYGLAIAKSNVETVSMIPVQKCLANILELIFWKEGRLYLLSLDSKVANLISFLRIANNGPHLKIKSASSHIYGEVSWRNKSKRIKAKRLTFVLMLNRKNMVRNIPQNDKHVLLWHSINV